MLIRYKIRTVLSKFCESISISPGIIRKPMISGGIEVDQIIETSILEARFGDDCLGFLRFCEAIL